MTLEHVSWRTLNGNDVSAIESIYPTVHPYICMYICALSYFPMAFGFSPAHRFLVLLHVTWWQATDSLFSFYFVRRNSVSGSLHSYLPYISLCSGLRHFWALTHRQNGQNSTNPHWLSVPSNLVKLFWFEALCSWSVVDLVEGWRRNYLGSLAPRKISGW